MTTILIIILIVLLIGGLPQCGVHNCGYWPSGGIGLILLVILILVLLGRL